LKWKGTLRRPFFTRARHGSRGSGKAERHQHNLVGRVFPKRAARRNCRSLLSSKLHQFPDTKALPQSAAGSPSAAAQLAPPPPRGFLFARPLAQPRSRCARATWGRMHLMMINVEEIGGTMTPRPVLHSAGCRPRVLQCNNRSQRRQFDAKSRPASKRLQRRARRRCAAAKRILLAPRFCRYEQRSF
jgi:hypothetical protein